MALKDYFTKKTLSVDRMTYRQEKLHSSLLDLCGSDTGISKETHKNGNIRYRIKTAEGTPGVWISKYDVLGKTIFKYFEYTN